MPLISLVVLYAGFVVLCLAILSAMLFAITAVSGYFRRRPASRAMRADQPLVDDLRWSLRRRSETGDGAAGQVCDPQLAPEGTPVS